jgi:hypothetical protein
MDGYQCDFRSRRGLHRRLSVQLHDVVLSRTHPTIDQCEARVAVPLFLLGLVEIMLYRRNAGRQGWKNQSKSLGHS